MEERTQTSSWFAVYTRHQHEKAVAGFLSRQGLETFLPLYGAARRWKDRIKRLSLPLFPNYVFVLGDDNLRRPVLSAPGVYDFVRRGGSPAPVPSADIEAIRTLVQRELSAEPHPFLTSGDRVRIKSGPLEGLEGILVRKRNFYRLILSVDVLARSIAIEVDAADVERVMVTSPRAGRVSNWAWGGMA